MSMNGATVQQLVHEGIQTVDDLVNFDEDSLKQVAENLRRPPGRIPDPTIGQAGGAAAGAMIQAPPFPFSAKSQSRLLVATDLLKFYRTIGFVITPGSMQWNPVMQNFSEQWKAIKDAKKETQPEVPVITKALPIIRWSESFKDHLSRCTGVRNISLAYVVRETIEVPAACPAREPNQPYTTEHGSVMDDLVNRASHANGLFPADSAEVYYKLEEATRGTPYADSIKPFQHRKQGREAFLALIAQYAGNDKWEAEIRKATTLLHQRKWKSSQNFSLEKFVSLHRNAFVSMEASAQHVEYQLPNEHSRVGYVLDAIESEDAGLRAAMANIESDTGPNGKRGDFEAAVAYLLPKDPVAKKRVQFSPSGKRNSAEISEVKAEVSDFGTKKGIGKTGVHFCFYKQAEYLDLTKEQQDELREWRKKNPGKVPKKSTDPKKPKSDKATIQAAIKRGVDKELAVRKKEADEEEEFKSYLKGLMSGDSDTTATASAATAKKNKQQQILKDILKKAKAGGKS